MPRGYIKSWRQEIRREAHNPVTLFCLGRCNRAVLARHSEGPVSKRYCDTGRTCKDGLCIGPEQAVDLRVITSQPTRVGPERWQHHADSIDDEAAPRDRHAFCAYSDLRMKMARNFPQTIRFRSLVPKNKPLEQQCVHAPTSRRHRPRIMVSGDPDPVAPSHQAAQEVEIRFGKRRYAGIIIETVAEAHNAIGLQRIDLVTEPGKCFRGFVWRQERAATSRDSLGFAQVQIRNTQQGMIRPP